jgi:hypothetical protein
MNYYAAIGDIEEALVSGYSLVRDLGDLFRVVSMQDTRQITMENDFCDKYFTPTTLENFIAQSKQVNKFLEFKVNPSRVRSVKEGLKALSLASSSEEVVDMLIRDPQISKEILRLAKEESSDREEILASSAKLNSLYLENAELERQIESVRKKLDILREENQLLETKLGVVVSRIKYRHERKFEVDDLMSINCNFIEYSKILYIKEITRVKYVDSTVNYLQEILRSLKGVPARLVVIEPPYAYGRRSLYPKLADFTDLTYQDVHHSDIFMAGFQSELMKDILRNPSRRNFLIILDRGGYTHNHVTGKGVETIYTVSDLNDLEGTYSPGNVISYKKSTLNIPHIAGFEGLDEESRISKYSSLPIIQSFVEFLERS